MMQATHNLESYYGEENNVVFELVKSVDTVLLRA